jgi:hypothetical protein
VYNTPVDEQIYHWNVVEKQYKRVEFVEVITRLLLYVTILSGQCAVVSGIFATTLS